MNQTEKQKLKRFSEMDYKLELIEEIEKLEHKMTRSKLLIEGRRRDIKLLMDEMEELQLKLQQSTSVDEQERLNSYIQRTINSISSKEKLIQEFQNELPRLSAEAETAKEKLERFAEGETETQALLEEEL